MTKTDHSSVGQGSRLNVAVIGLGMIGGVIARRLLERDVYLVVFDVQSDTATELVAAGARLAKSCADAAAQADVVIVAVVDDAQVREVMSPVEGVLATARPGTIAIIHSTVRLDTVRRVAAEAASRDVQVLDAGVSTLGEHDQGTLELFVGGESSTLNAARPVLAHYTHDLDHLGPLGSGMTAKLLRNLLGYALMATAYEVFALAETVGVDLAAFRRVLEESDVLGQAHRIFAMRTTHPVTESDLALSYYKQFTELTGEQLVVALQRNAAHMAKDIDDALALADDADFDLEITPAARPLLRRLLLLPPGGLTTST